jgi:DNA/RNA-binding domain of Phe-tRNA-synthetase-like protein
MSIKRITISVPSDVASRIKKAAGRVPVSAWVTEVIEEHLDDAQLEREWQRFYAEVKPKPQDLRRAAAIFKRVTKRGQKRGAA